MPISSTDILFLASVTSGAAGYSSAAGSPGTFLGKYASTTVITDATLDNIFPDITGDENAADNVDYQCIFVLNNHATLSLQTAVVWFAGDVAGGATVQMGIDAIGPVAKGTAGAQAALIANKNTAPTGVGTFSDPTTKSAGLAIGTLAPGQVRAVWIKRTATNSAALNNDGFTLRVEGDTSA